MKLNLERVKQHPLPAQNRKASKIQPRGSHWREMLVDDVRLLITGVKILRNGSDVMVRINFICAETKVMLLFFSHLPGWVSDTCRSEAKGLYLLWCLWLVSGRCPYQQKARQVSAFKQKQHLLLLCFLKCLFSHLIAVTPRVLHKLDSFPGQISIPVCEANMRSKMWLPVFVFVLILASSCGIPI